MNVTFIITGTSQVPTVSLFNGTRSASTFSTGSPYTFTYTLQAGDNGAIMYRVQTVAQNNSAAADVTLTDPGHFAGTRCVASHPC